MMALFLKLRRFFFASLRKCRRYGTPLRNGSSKSEYDLVPRLTKCTFRYALGTFRFTVLCHLGNPENKIDTVYFNLDFHKFLIVLKDALKMCMNRPKVGVRILIEFLQTRK